MKSLLLEILKRTKPHPTRFMIYHALLFPHLLARYRHPLRNLYPVRPLASAHRSSSRYQQRLPHQFLLPVLRSVAQRVTINNPQSPLMIRRLVACLDARLSASHNPNA
jgi:hypothetical protein